MTIKNPILHPVTADISGDLKNQLRPLMFQITQGDTDSHILDISLVNGASIVELSDVATVAVVFTKEDGTVSVGSADIIDMKAGKVQKTIKTSDVSCVGNVIFAVEVHEGTSQASSCQFRFPVVATLDSSDGIVSENNYSVLTSLINDVQASVDSANDAAILANDAASIANSAASAATASAERVETAVQNSETAVDNANTATTAANNAKVTIEANEDTRQQNETARITKESERLSAEILRIDAESDRSSSESQRILAEDDRKTSETSRKSGETNRISAENTRVNSENSRISAESTRSDDEDTRVSNESTRVFSENQRKTNETDRVLQFNDVLEFAMLSESDAGVLDYTTEKDESGRVIRRNFTDSTGIVRKSIERLDFNANDDPVTIKKKTFSASAKGESYKKHTVGYSVDGGVVSDAVVELPYEAVESVTTARNSITSDPVELYNPDSNIASFQANELVKRMPFRNVLANNMSSLEIIGNKMVEPFATGKDEYIDADGMPYVGGDTLDINYDFYTKTAGDTNPMKIYSANIDPSNPPAPTDLSWKEITDQATIDRLKLQNELPITSTDTTGRTAVYGGQNYVLQNSTNPAVRDDFAGKVAGDTAVNPNVAYRRAAMTTLQTPSMFTSGDELVNNNNYNGYGSLMVLNDSKTIFAMSPSSGQIPQILLSFDLIRIWEDKYDLIPIDRTGTADEVKARQVAWLKGNIRPIIGKAHVYGVCPIGNKAYLATWNGSAWANGGVSNANSNPTQLTWGIENMNYVDANGMCHFLVYTDPASTTSDKILVLTGHGLITNDIIVNTTRNAFRYVTKVNDNVLTVSALITNQQSGDIIKKFKYRSLKTAENGTTSSTLIITAHGLVTGDVVSSGKGWSVVTKVDDNTLTCDAPITGQVAGDSIALASTIGTQTAESTVIPSTVYLDYASIELQYKIPAGYDVLVPSNPRRDAGQSNILMLEKVYNSQTLDYAGKVSGSVVENGNVFKRTNTNGAFTTLQAPSGSILEADDPNIDVIETLGGAYPCSSTTSINNQISQHLFSFNIIAECERKWTAQGIAYPYKSDATVAEKVAWFKANIQKLNWKWYGYGSKPAGNKAYLSVFDNSSNLWNSGYTSTNTANTPTLTQSYVSASGDLVTLKNTIASDGFVHFLAYTDASDGITVSTIYTDYISLQIDFINGNKATLAFTQQSVELESLTSGKAPAYLVECDLTSIATALYGGSNASLKNALKSITVDAWAMGSGALNGSLGYGAIMKWWDATAWSVRTSHTLPYIQKLPGTTSVPTVWVMTTNKFYCIIYPQYPSDATVPSSLSLDYMQIKVQLSRTPDVVAPKQVYLPRYWAMVVQGFSPNWDSTQANEKYVLWMNKDDNNYYSLRWNGSGKWFRFSKMYNGSALAISPTSVLFSKNQINSLLIAQTSAGMVIKALLNNGTTVFSANTDTNLINGIVNLYFMVSTGGMALQADAFVQRFTLIDLDRMGWQDGIPDATAEQILRGTYHGFEFPVQTGTVKILPNNKYTLTGSGDLYIGGYKTRTVTTGDIITNDRENKIVLTDGSTIQLKM